MRIGLFGGTFSPPHNGHVRAAKLFSEKLSLDKLIVMPDGKPPHKEADESGTKQRRYDMTCLAFSDFAEVSDYEMKKNGKSYTYETLEYLSEKYPDDEILFLMGDDMLMSFDTWKHPEIIAKIAKLVYMSRGENYERLKNKADELEKSLGAVCISLEEEPFEVSSSKIREMLKNGESIEAFVPEKVEEYIREHGLYR